MNNDLIYDTKKQLLAKYPRFGNEVAGAKIKFKDGLITAATDGENVFVDPKYFAELSEDDRVFLIAHEIMHIKFMHMFRLMDKNGNKRDMKVWNDTTDAIINANLERDGFKIKEGYINRPEALQYTAEEFYDILMKEKENNKSNQGSENSGQSQEDNSDGTQGSGNSGQSQEDNSDETQGSGNSGQSQEDNSDETQGSGNSGQSQEGNSDEPQGENPNEDKNQGDDHSLWEEAFEKQQNKEGKAQNADSSKVKQEDNSEEDQEETISDSSESDIDEKNEFEENRKEKREAFKAKRENTERKIRGENDETINFGDVGEGNDAIDWRQILRREIEKSETVWSQRRSIKENNYAYRLEENDVEEDAETEVMIDVSGSVSLDMVKAFLRVLKPLIKESKLRVGCFNEMFWGMKNIDSIRDIDKFSIPREVRGSSAWTEDWDLAVRSFTKKREINKIVFTDGWPQPGTMPKQDLKKENVIWLVYGNRDFKPCCGKVIYITKQQLKKLNQTYSYER